MSDWIPESFRCIEPIATWQARDLTTTQHEKLFIELRYKNCKKNVVQEVVDAINQAKNQNIPLILLRSDDQYEYDELPAGFSIGLQSSGTTGKPKLIFHAWEKLLPKKLSKKTKTWLLCYHPMSFAGLQVILQAILSGNDLIASAASEVQEKAELALTYNVDAMSLTPSYFKAMLLCWKDQAPPIKSLTFGGEICDQATLDIAQEKFPHARIRHIYASTEAGVLFSVQDKQAGFPKAWLGEVFNGWQVLVDKGEIVLNKNDQTLVTGDRVEVQEQRIKFLGRDDSIANVGGAKVDLERLEQKIIELDSILDARVYAKSNPITGSLVCLEVCAKDEQMAKKEIAQLNSTLVAVEQARLIDYVEQITLSDAGKKLRRQR